MLVVTLSGGVGGPATQGDAGFLSGLMSSISSAVMPKVGSFLQSYPGLADKFVSQIAKQDLGKLMGGATSSEDCLFLDVYVPGKALKGGKKLPVVNWIYGGAFIVGSKDGMYDGTPLVKQADGNVIYVAGNYRVTDLHLAIYFHFANVSSWEALGSSAGQLLSAMRHPTQDSGIREPFLSGSKRTSISSMGTKMMSQYGENPQVCLREMAEF